MQNLNADSPLLGLATLWEGLYYHLLNLFYAFINTPETRLMSGHIASQFTHLYLGLLLSIGILASILNQSSKKIALCIFVAWAGCTQEQIAWSGSLAKNDWGMTMLVFLSISLILNRRLGWAVFAYGSAWVIKASAIFSALGFFVLWLNESIRAPSLNRILKTKFYRR